MIKGMATNLVKNYYISKNFHYFKLKKAILKNSMSSGPLI